VAVLVGTGIAGTFALTPDIFDRWSDIARLSEDLCECCAILEIRSGLRFQVSDEQLTVVHTAWKQDCALWLENLLPQGSKDLSHLKKAAVLLSKMCEFVPITVEGEGHKDQQLPPATIQDGEPWPELPNTLPEKQIRKFKDGGCHFVAWLILYHVCEFFERNRTDQLDPFESRITEEFERDMVSALLSAKLSAQSIHMILKALFLRD
jgi:hypothetical protein